MELIGCPNSGPEGSGMERRPRRFVEALARRPDGRNEPRARSSSQNTSPHWCRRPDSTGPSDYDADVSTEQIAGLAIIASSVVAIASALINALSSKNNTQQTLDAQARITAQTLDTQTATTTLTLEHERLLAREARLWDRTADAYVQMLEMVAVFMVIVDETYPTLGDGGRGDPPAPPESNDVKALMARMAAYGSPEAYAAVEAWWTTRLDFDRAAWELDTVRARSPGVDARDFFNLSEADQYAKLNDARAASHRAVRALQDEINEELRG